MYKSLKSSNSGSGQTRHSEKTGSRYNIGTYLIDEEEFKQGCFSAFSLKFAQNEM